MVYVIIASLLFITDEFIKNYVEKTFKAGITLPVLKGKLLLKKYHNKGAMLDFGAKKQPVIAILSICFTIFMTGIFAVTICHKGNQTLKCGLALLLGGAYSNTYDRLKRKYVVDYVSFAVKNTKIRNIVFNISDFGIIIGALILVLAS